jgi:hypothetical protein
MILRQQSHTFASRTSRHTSQSLQKSVPLNTVQSAHLDLPATQTNASQNQKSRFGQYSK